MLIKELFSEYTDNIPNPVGRGVLLKICHSKDGKQMVLFAKFTQLQRFDNLDEFERAAAKAVGLDYLRIKCRYTPDMLDAGLKGIIGKGARTRAVVDAIKRNGAVYFVAIGGAGAFYKSAIKSAEVIAFPELLSEAVTKLEVEGFECVVGVDSKGNDIFNK